MTAARAPEPPIQRLASAMRACRTGFLFVVVFSFAINLLMLTAPLYMLQVFDRVITSRSTDTLVFLTILAVAAFLTLGALEAVRNHVMVRIGVWLDRRLGGAILTGNIAATLKRGAPPSVQGLRDLSTFRTFLAGPAMFPILDAPWTPIFIAVIFLLHPLVGWIALAGAGLLFAIALINEIATRKLLALSSNASIRALGQAETAVRNADVIEAMGMMPNLIRRWDRLNDEMLSLQARASLRSGRLTAMAKFLRLCLQVAILGAGAWLVLQGEMTPGAMIAGAILVGRALAPVDQAINSWKSAIAARQAYRRMKQQIAATPPRGAGMALPVPKGALSARKLSYIHPGAPEPTLRNLNFELTAGETMGLIGPTAAGKTTLARVLVGNLQPQAGFVRLDGADVAQWDPDALGQFVGYLPQDVELFGGTVQENIARMGEGDPNAVIAAAKLAGVHDMILGLPNGYDTPIGEGGAALSGGQRQRIGLARALYGEPKLVVLDEPNASLDQPGEQALVEAIAALKRRGVTIVVIAHRPNVLRFTDKILVLRNGAVQMFGPRDEIVAQLTGPAADNSPAQESQEKGAARGRQ